MKQERKLEFQSDKTHYFFVCSSLEVVRIFSTMQTLNIFKILNMQTAIFGKFTVCILYALKLGIIY